MTTTAKERVVSLRAPQSPKSDARITVASTTFEPGGMIPARVAFSPCGGENVSPQLSWSGFPPGTQSFALTCLDPDAPSGTGFWHWVLADIPARVTSLDENAAAKGLPLGATQGFTDFGTSHWGGPCPPIGDIVHRYLFTVYALDIPAIEGAGPSMSGAKLVCSMRGHLLAQGSIEGRYGR
jgi:Raf kinase inhibitor-like YbhB/YbcL family protein